MGYKIILGKDRIKTRLTVKGLMAEQEQKKTTIKLTTDLKQFIDSFVHSNYDEDTKSWGDYS